VIPLNR